jgi:hypothetical protein
MLKGSDIWQKPTVSFLNELSEVLPFHLSSEQVFMKAVSKEQRWG